MFLTYNRPNYLQLVPYFHFAEPFPTGMVVAYTDVVVPDDQLADAAEALRTAEIESVRTEAATCQSVSDGTPLGVLKTMKISEADLESMSIDKVREVANVLDVPNRGTITEKSELIQDVLRQL